MKKILIILFLLLVNSCGKPLTTYKDLFSKATSDLKIHEQLTNDIALIYKIKQKDREYIIKHYRKENTRRTDYFFKYNTISYITDENIIWYIDSKNKIFKQLPEFSLEKYQLPEHWTIKYNGNYRITDYETIQNEKCYILEPFDEDINQDTKFNVQKRFWTDFVHKAAENLQNEKKVKEEDVMRTLYSDYFKIKQFWINKENANLLKEVYTGMNGEVLTREYFKREDVFSGWLMPERIKTDIDGNIFLDVFLLKTAFNSRMPDDIFNAEKVAEIMFKD